MYAYRCNLVDAHLTQPYSYTPHFGASIHRTLDGCFGLRDTGKNRAKAQLLSLDDLVLDIELPPIPFKSGACISLTLEFPYPLL